MSQFRFTAYDSAGIKLSDTIEAESLDVAKNTLKKKGLLVSDIKPLNSGWKDIRIIQEKVTLDDLEFLTSELSILLASGVKIDKALTIISKNKASGAMSRLISDILSEIKKGRPLAEAFEVGKSIFDPLYFNLIRIGEATGRLPQVFEGLANDLKFRKELKAKIIQAVTYPAVILFVCVLCILFVFNYIVPQMGSIFAGSDDIPVYTAFLLGASDWMIRYQWFLFGGLALGIGVLYSSRKNPDVAARLADFAVSAPLISSVVIQTERIRFNSAMSLMLEAGVNVDNAIGYAANSIKNPRIRKSLTVAKERIKKGAGITSSLSATPIFTSFYLSLLEVGEESGRMQSVFDEISRRSKTEFENWTTRITSMLEPVLILVMGGIVGSVVVTMLLSVVSVNDVGI
ncbi:type II secretion system F family protein [Lacimicrobium sp. SS2-24]|uniref:type II secretion system F family protein n=1 Tax=Lacimicrobium sp. SS2-24 TaxID=2005569 RepID=UPI000B4ACEDF|nr:type II secretion system F family protein [Lacimicrobium sp. SS2-24]